MRLESIVRRCCSFEQPFFLSQPTTEDLKPSIANGECKAIIVLHATTANMDIDVNFHPALIGDGLNG
jgi:hypothetical protein